MVVIRSTKFVLDGVAQEETSEEILAVVQGLNPVFTRTFTQIDLTVAGVLPVTHGLKTLTVKARVWNSSNQEIRPDSVTPFGIDSVGVGMETFMPLSGIFLIQITKVG